MNFSYLEIAVSEDSFVLLPIDCAIGYKIIMTTVLIAAVGKTTVPKSATKGPGNPTIKSADPKNTVPEITFRLLSK